MSLRAVNQFFGYGLFGVGAAKVIFAILVFMQAFTTVSNILNGGSSAGYDYYYYYLIFSRILGGAQLLLAIGSIIMILINSTQQPSVLTGYLWGLGAILIEVIASSFEYIYIFVLFSECGMYMKGGQKIISNNESYRNEFREKTNKKRVKNTEWYYGNKNEQNEYITDKNQKKIEKIEKELEEWKQLLDDGEIDELTYNEETARLIEKEKKLH